MNLASGSRLKTRLKTRLNTVSRHLPLAVQPLHHRLSPSSAPRVPCKPASPELAALPQQAQTIDSISGHTYIRKRISLTLFVKRLILWSEVLFQRFLSDATLFVCRAVTFFNEINLRPHNSYYLRNTVKLIRRSSSIIDEYIYPISPRDVGRFAYLGSA